MGGNITFTCGANNSYTIEVSILRDCNGISPDNSIPVDIFSNECSINSTQTATLASGFPQVVTPLCPSEPDACLTSSGTYGVELYVYKVTVNIPSGCSDIIVSYDDCCRNGAITTLTAPGSEDIFLHANLNTDLNDCNSSPYFQSTPVPFVCVGQQVAYSQDAVDPDGDQLVFSLVDCQDDDVSNSVSYTGTFGGTNPLTASNISIDPNTGVVSFVPTALQVAVVCVLVEEFRNGIKIGETIRDLQFTVLNCNIGNIPVVSGADGTAGTGGVTGLYDEAACIFDQLCFDLQSYDADNENITLSWNNGIPNATFTVFNNGTPSASAQLCWTPTFDDIGTHYFTVTAEDNSCPFVGTNTFSYSITVNGLSFNNFTYTQNSVSCNGGSDGSATITINDPNIQNPTITWLTDPEQTGLTGTNLSAGVQQVLLEDNTLSCTAVLQVNINEPAPIQINEGPQSAEITCQLGNDGAIDVFPTGGTNPYSYEWSHDTNLTSNVATGLVQGYYTVTVTDNNGCTLTQSFTRVNTSTVLLSGFSSNYNGYGVSCHGASDGSLDFFVAGGLAPYTYEWSNGATVQDQFNLEAGTYTLTVYDAEGCQKSITRTLESPPPLDLSADGQDNICVGGTDGTIEMTVEGGVPAYSYVWDGVSSNAPTVSNLAAAAYSVTVTDQNACTAFMDSITVVQPDSILITKDSTSFQMICADDNTASLFIDIEGGTQPFQIMWTNGEMTDSIYNLSANIYTVNITDVNGCTASESFEVISPPDIMVDIDTSDYNGFNISCLGGNDGWINLNVSGGEAPYTYMWSNGPSSALNDNLTEGTYTVTITDNLTCSQEYTFVLNEPTDIAANYTHTNVTCFGADDGSVLISTTGGVAPYTYQWTNAVALNESAIDLPAGFYTVTITDQNNCSFIINSIEIQEPQLLQLSIDITELASCQECNVPASVTTTIGGTPPYSYEWSNGDTGSDIVGLCPGDAFATVTDGNGCTAIATIYVPSVPNFTLDSIDVVSGISCYGDSDGAVEVHVTGGTAPFQYVWDADPNQDSVVLTNIGEGWISVAVTDAEMCTDTISYYMEQPDSLSVGMSSDPVSCYNYEDGIIYIDYMEGGTTPYIYSYNNENFSYLDSFPYEIHLQEPGVYTYYFEDANGCIIQESVEVENPDSLFVVIVPSDTLINLGQEVTLSYYTNATPTYWPVWSNEYLGGLDTAITVMLAPIDNTIVELTITEHENECTATTEGVVRVALPNVYIPNAFSPNNDGFNEAFTIYSGEGYLQEVQSLEIYDRWGNMVFQNKNFAPNQPELGWNGLFQGDKAPPAVYVYLTTVEFIDGTIETYSGDLTLLR